MRRIISLGVLLVGGACGGCKTAEKNPSTAPPAPLHRRVTATTLPSPNDKPTLRPIEAVSGRVIAVREPLRFVVIDFGTGKMPKLEQVLSVYRLDQRVAELKVSGPFYGTTVAADITAGDVREGDLVREQ